MYLSSGLPYWSDFFFVSMRIYPHLQDSGGFFVAVLERKHVEAKPNRYSMRCFPFKAFKLIVDGAGNESVPPRIWSPPNQKRRSPDLEASLMLSHLMFQSSRRLALMQRALLKAVAAVGHSKRCRILFCPRGIQLCCLACKLNFKQELRYFALIIVDTQLTSAPNIRISLVECARS